MLKSLLPNDVKVKITIDDIRLRSNFTTNKTIRFTKVSFCAILGFTQSHSDPLNNPPPSFIKKVPGLYKSEKPNNITGIDKIKLKCDCINGSILNGVRQHFWYSFALDKPPCPKIYKKPNFKIFKAKKFVLFHTFFLEDDHRKSIDFNGETISFACPIVKNDIILINK